MEKYNYYFENLNLSLKKIYISVSGFVDLSNLAIKILDTPEFQRLRNLHQLSVAYLVYPSSSHSRFEHSLGVYYYISKLLLNIKSNTNKDDLNKWIFDSVPELRDYFLSKKDNDYFDNYFCELIKIAGLCHDIGHGPFSHTFDDIFMKDKQHPLKHHEARSQFITNKILKGLIPDEHIKFIQILIDPPLTRKGFVYQIVANKQNSIDIDKIDYIMRDCYTVGLKFSFDEYFVTKCSKIIDNQICFPDSFAFEILNIFSARYRLFKQIYTHKTVCSVQFMVGDILKLLDPILKLSDSVYDIDKFTQLNDNYIFEITKFFYNNQHLLNDDNKINIQKAHELLLRINKREIYKLKFKKTFSSKEERDEYFESNIKNKYNCDKYIVHLGKIGWYPKLSQNPLTNIWFFNKKNPDKKFIIEDKFQISPLYPTNPFEYTIKVFIK